MISSADQTEKKCMVTFLLNTRKKSGTKSKGTIAVPDKGLKGTIAVPDKGLKGTIAVPDKELEKGKLGKDGKDGKERTFSVSEPDSPATKATLTKLGLNTYTDLPDDYKTHLSSVWSVTKMNYAGLSGETKIAYFNSWKEVEKRINVREEQLRKDVEKEYNDKQKKMQEEMEKNKKQEESQKQQKNGFCIV